MNRYDFADPAKLNDLYQLREIEEDMEREAHENEERARMQRLYNPMNADE